LTRVFITFLLLVTQTFPYSEWEENGGGFSANLVKRLLKNLPPPQGSAVVLNAKGGREVSVLSKADMKVVACYSAGKESYPGKLTATVPTVLEEQEEEIEAARLGVEWTGLGGCNAHTSKLAPLRRLLLVRLYYKAHLDSICKASGFEAR
jgi:hypothetical protein